MSMVISGEHCQSDGTVQLDTYTGSPYRNMEDLSIWSADDVVSGRSASPTAAKDEASPAMSAASSTALLTTATQGQQAYAAKATTISSPNVSALYDRLRGQVSPEVVRSGDRIPAELLLNGARAVGAFCRPYPTATVGTPLSMSFDVRTSRFEVIIEVASTDSANATSFTEIYVPFVHYASDADSMSLDSAGTRGRDGPVQAKVHHDAQKGISKQNSLGLELDLTVKINEGRYELDGQYLKWYYEAPANGKKTMRLNLRRARGPIAARMEQSIPSWGDLCPIGKEDCIIM